MISESCDLSDFILPASIAIAKGECEQGIFVDGVGYGSAMVEDAPGIEDALAAFYDFIGDDLIVGHNIHRFDISSSTRSWVRNSRRGNRASGSVPSAGIFS